MTLKAEIQTHVCNCQSHAENLNIFYLFYVAFYEKNSTPLPGICPWIDDGFWPS